VKKCKKENDGTFVVLYLLKVHFSQPKGIGWRLPRMGLAGAKSKGLNLVFITLVLSSGFVNGLDIICVILYTVNTFITHPSSLRYAGQVSFC